MDDHKCLLRDAFIVTTKNDRFLVTLRIYILKGTLLYIYIYISRSCLKLSHKVWTKIVSQINIRLYAICASKLGNIYLRLSKLRWIAVNIMDNLAAANCFLQRKKKKTFVFGRLLWICVTVLMFWYATNSNEVFHSFNIRPAN